MNALDRAADRLRGRWTKGTWLDDTGNVCLSGAIREVCVGENGWVNFEQVEELKAVVVDTIVAEALVPHWSMEPSGGMILSFNDARATSEEDVLLLLKKASARLEDDES